ncbi:unnamed protein product [Prorocentrum cordatum]|uniref:Sodium/calcium exchanger membrane region domain-containing protein n=1 Tax=Prorocentrum cordatum TaxID=2364126 RepID=A0ABN9SMV0_9DINO|nr:unnamed protein product [Polarella glacialis]
MATPPATTMANFLPGLALFNARRVSAHENVKNRVRRALRRTQSQQLPESRQQPPSSKNPTAQSLTNSLLPKSERPQAESVGILRGILGVCIEPISVLLVALPFGVASSLYGWGHTWTFTLNFIALIPLAQILGNATEELAEGLQNDTLGGLLNATFGNAVEMILTIQTLMTKQYIVVKATLLGSILSNLLLVLGCSIFAGGIKRKTQTFSKEGASANISLLLLAATSLALPACFLNIPAVVKENAASDGALSLEVSRVVSLIVLCCYMAFLFFQFVTHTETFNNEEGSEEDDGKGPSIRPWLALVLLAFTTVLVAFCSELLVDSIEGIVTAWGIPERFIGMILLPIVGNACEHFGAVKFAIKDKMDVTIGIAVGSATQMALFVVPFAVLMGWALQVPPIDTPSGPRGMDLDFGGLDTIIMCASVLLAFSILNDGESNWLEGFMLIAAYLIVATLYWCYPTHATTTMTTTMATTLTTHATTTLKTTMATTLTTMIG